MVNKKLHSDYKAILAKMKEKSSIRKENKKTVHSWTA